ncbi:LON peptidase substrate-binding domain-containing protein [Luteimonas sp. 50]|uniref:LON peptidase substrate-binding domain-containing protein n=1 Tax=Cognatiluteimonas sedimenti TaxID=2927791 RepID=A0ABT0A3L1_9GAMM|nr:LON peptidase substrate-binding domain-containing protein [Lysobacter sedimenti]MCJ0825579.1 LON peptidase substrate-binding domain-containing protein [Lysobacter sedimenti]
MPSNPQTLGLFPLPSVLLPGAALGLRVFEPRYLDLVRDCGREGSGFGVCLLMAEQGAEGGAAAPAAWGTEARIEDFGSDERGLLTLRVRGCRRFRVQRTRVRSNGLVIGEIRWRDPDPYDELRPEHALLGVLLQRILDQAGGEHASAAPAQLDDAAWVGWRLAELLPLGDLQRQQLLQEDDPHARLQQLLALMP